MQVEYPKHRWSDKFLLLDFLEGLRTTWREFFKPKVTIRYPEERLEPANRFGPEFLTYVLWAVSPEGRADNLGEVLLEGSKSKLDVTSQLQAFALIVTAEPYYAVAQPSESLR